MAQRVTPNRVVELREADAAVRAELTARCDLLERDLRELRQTVDALVGASRARIAAELAAMKPRPTDERTAA